jgi:hypothetical protein
LRIFHHILFGNRTKVKRDINQDGPTNILVSSTRQWNPGDEFIFFGIRNLFLEAIGDRKINWVLYDRHPDLNVNGFKKRIHRRNLLHNSFHKHDPGFLDIAVVAGTPEWFGPPLRQFYNAVIRSELPLFLIGVGYIDSPIVFSALESHCLKKLAHVITARDNYASQALQNAGIKNHLLPCPALFASMQCNTPNEIKKIGFILQMSKTPNQAIPQDLVRRCLSTIKKFRAEGKQVDIICHYIDEFSEFSGDLAPVRYSFDARDYIEILSEYDCILSTRLHGAILANSLGRPAILLYKNDPRSRASSDLFPFIDLCEPEEASGRLESIDCVALQRLPIWKEEIKKQYLSLLKSEL